MVLGSTNQLPNRHVRSNRFTQDYNHTALTLQKYRHGVIFAYFAFWDFSWNLNGTLPYWYQQVHTLGHSSFAVTCFFISFWRTKSSRAFSWSSLVQWSNRFDDCTVIESQNMKHFKNTSLNEIQHTIFLPEPSVHETLGATYVGPCTSYFSGTIPQSRIYSRLPPHQPRVETGKAATKLLLQFSTTIERLGKNGRSFEDRRYHPTWFEEPSYWLLLYTHIQFIYMIGWFSWYSLFIPLTALDDSLISAPQHQTRKEVQQVQPALCNCFTLPYHCSKQRHITCFLPAFQVSSRRSCITAHFFFCLASSSILASDKVLTIMA